MRRFLAILITTGGIFGSSMLLRADHQWLALLAFLGTVYVFFAIWVEVIKTTSLHYRLVDRYFEKELKRICKACPYWGLVFASSIIGALHVIILTLWLVVYNIWLNLGHLPAMVSLWLVGFKPRYWLPRQALIGEDGQSYRLENREVPAYKSRHDLDYAYRLPFWRSPIVSIGILILVGTGLLIRFSEADHILSLVQWLGRYYGLAAYAALVAAVLLGQSWKHGVWPATKWVYRKSCPGVRFADPAEEPAQPQRPSSRPRPQRG